MVTQIRVIGWHCLQGQQELLSLVAALHVERPELTRVATANNDESIGNSNCTTQDCGTCTAAVYKI